ncbi:MAG: hypothetical protein NZL89_04855 [Leptospiraceae bacterium]|nr:hypothetical protein [Leptospiraceae bacterium]
MAQKNRQHRIGVVNFLNAYPLWAALEGKPGIVLVPSTPALLLEKMLKNELSAALLSSVAWLKFSNRFQLHPSLCIAAVSAVESIRLFVPSAKAINFAEQARSLTTIFTDAASRSSVAQLRVMLHAVGATPQLVEIAEPEKKIQQLKQGEAVLAIGDTALRHRSQPSYDLQQEYYALFQYGFVYAFWFCLPETVGTLFPLLGAAYTAWLTDQENYLKQAQHRFGFSREFTEQYLKNIIQYQYGKKEQQDFAFFKEKLEALESPLSLP